MARFETSVGIDDLVGNFVRAVLIHEKKKSVSSVAFFYANPCIYGKKAVILHRIFV